MPLRTHTVHLALAPWLTLAVACGSVVDPGTDGGDSTADAAPGDDVVATECEPGFSECADDVETRCGADGFFEEPTECSVLGCDGEGTRCLEVEPSNGLGAFLDAAEAGPVLDISAPAFIDTTEGTIVVGGSPVAVSSELLDAPDGGVAVRVFPVASLTVTAEVNVEGGPALAFVSAGDISIQALVRVGGRLGVGGPGAGPDGNGLLGTTDNGGGGGGFRGRGGEGGLRGSGAGTPGGGGPEVGNQELVPLRGGGRGNGTVSGGGGGAIQLVSRTSLVVTGGGAIDAGGAGGRTFITSSGGGGGGAGGGILLEAPTVFVLGGTTVLAANGGGGGCQGGAANGEDGRLDTIRAAGCVAGGDNGNGGAGGAEFSLNGLKGGDATGTGRGGGGGGGVGRIRINTASGSFSAQGSPIITPSASTGEIGVR